MMLDNVSVSASCPRCDFQNPFTVRQARWRDVIICRGCKVNIHLDDQMNECRKAVRSLSRAINELQSSFNKLNLTINI
jgi:hypothetical protein